MKQWACFECGEPCVLSVPGDCNAIRPSLCPYKKDYEAAWKSHDEAYFKEDFRKAMKEAKS